MTLFSAELPWCYFCVGIKVLEMTWKSMENYFGIYKKSCGPPGLYSFTSILYIFQNNLLWFSGHSENFCFCTKITPWQFYWKQRQSWLVPFKSCKIESKTRAKLFGKVDTTETYQLPKLKPFCLSLSNSVDKLKVIKKNFYKLCLLLLL